MQTIRSIIAVLFPTILLMQLFFLSCNKFLDKKPNAALTVPTTLTELQGLFNDAERMNFGLTPSMTESSADDYFLMPYTYNALPTQFQQVYNWTLKEYKFQNDWSANYLPVYNANFALESLEKIPYSVNTQAQWNVVKGCALFTRAYSFLNLAWEYAKAYDPATSSTDYGIVLRSGSDFNQPSRRASVRETYNQIIADAKEATPYLGDLSDNVLLPSKAACYGLLARTYLSMRYYDSAFKYSDLCLGLKNSLLDYNQVPLNNNAPFPRLNNSETIFYTEMNTFNGNHYPYRGFVDSSLCTSYNSNDLRKKGFFKPDNNYFRFKGAYTADENYLFTGIATDELFLVRSECYARLGMITEAMEDLNTLMKKRWNNQALYPVITASGQQDALQKILMERRKELLMRGIRWSDIKRLNKEGANIIPRRLINAETYSLPPNDNRYALPIPTDIINITGLAQNEY